MWDSLITFIVRYEYARALFDKRAAIKFDGHASDLFQSLSKIEVSHAVKLEAFLPKRVIPLRSMFFEQEDYAIYKNEYLDGVSKRHIWTKFLFRGKPPSQWDLFETLAFCAAAERLETLGYLILGIIPRFRKVCQIIALEESHAERRIISLLLKSSPLSIQKTKLLIFGWYVKAFVAMIILVITGNK